MFVTDFFFFFSMKRVDEGRITTVKKFAKRYSEIRPYEGMTLETLAFQIFHIGNLTFIQSFDKAKFACLILPPKQ